MSTLPLQGASYQQGFSLDRDTQLRTVLEDAFSALHGSGFLSGGLVTKTAAYSIAIASGSQLFAEGKRLTLSALAAYTATEGAGTVYVWGKITRTAATQATKTALDTYALTVTHSLTDSTPSGYQFRVAILTLNGSGITAIDSLPAGKYLRPLDAALVAQRETIPASTVEVVPAGSQVSLFGSLSVKGSLYLGGKVRVSL